MFSVVFYVLAFGLHLCGRGYGVPPLTILTNWKIAKIFEFLRSYRLGYNDSYLKYVTKITGRIMGNAKLTIM